MWSLGQSRLQMMMLLRMILCLWHTYLNVATAGLMLHIVLGVDLRFGLVLEVHLQCLDLFVTPTRLVCRIVQRADFRLGIPLQLC